MTVSRGKETGKKTRNRNQVLEAAAVEQPQDSTEPLASLRQQQKQNLISQAPTQPIQQDEWLPLRQCVHQILFS